MTLQFAPAQPSEQSEIIAFLLQSFSADLQLTSFCPEVIHWKYFSSHPDGGVVAAFSCAKKARSPLMAEFGPFG